MIEVIYTVEQVQEIIKECSKHMLFRVAPVSFLLGVAVTVAITMVYVKSEQVAYEKQLLELVK